MLKFLADFGSLKKKTFLTPKFEPLDQIRRICEFSKQKNFLKSGVIDNSMQHQFG